jgi:folate-binding protein YgfZ
MSETVADSIEPIVVDSYFQLREVCAIFPTHDLALIELTGEDRKGWLQGQATNNLRSLDFGASSAFCLCEPTGQIISVCEIWSLRERFIVTLPRSCVAGFLRRVETMVVLEDVAATVLDANLVSIQGPDATARLAQLAQLPTLDASETDLYGQNAALLRSNRAGQGGWDVVLPAGGGDVAQRLVRDFGSIAPQAAESARIEAGIPEFGKDITSKTLPPELGASFTARHVSYTKGCYTGQEVLMRIHSRGHTNKTWMGLVSDGPLEVGATVSHSRRPDAGVVTSVANSPSMGYIGAATLRNEAALDGERVSIDTSAGKVEAEVREMPILRME